MSHSNSQRLIQRRPVSRRSGRNGLCFGCNNYRPLSIRVSLGTFPQEKSRRQTPYPIGFKGQYSYIHPHFRRQVARCQRSRSFAAGSRCILRNGPRLPGLRKALRLQPDSCIFRYSGQNKHAIQKTLFASCRKGNRTSLRSNNHAYRLLYEQALSGYTSSSEVSGCQHRKDTRFSHQQFYSAIANHNTTISQQVAGGTVFQMDQAAPEDKEVLWNIRKCRQVSGLDRGLCLYPRSDTKKTAEPSRKSLHNFTNFKCICFRKNRPFSTGYGERLQSL